MIVEMNEETIDDVVKFAWELSSQWDKGGFPRMHTYKNMYDRFLKSIQHEEDKVLACIKDDKLVGVLNLSVIKADHYLQSLGGILVSENFDEVANQFVNYLKVNYQGYEFYSGYPVENKAANQYFKDMNAELLDASVTMKLNKADFIKQPTSLEVITLSQDLYEAYALFHDRHYPNAYWNSERVFETLKMWKIYLMIRDNLIVSSLFVKFKTVEVEVFGMAIETDYKHQGIELELLSAATDDLLACKAEEILFFVDEDAIDEQMATLKIGFKQIDTYRCYKLKF